MTKQEYIESAIESFENMLKAAGMQGRYGTEKPRYFRNLIGQDHKEEIILVRYRLSEAKANYADNIVHTVNIQITATVIINSEEGCELTDYKELMKSIEEKSEAAGWTIKYGAEDTEEIYGDVATATQTINVEFYKLI